MKCPLCGTEKVLVEAFEADLPMGEAGEMEMSGDITLRFACGTKIEVPLRPWLRHSATLTYDTRGWWRETTPGVDTVTVPAFFAPDHLGMVRALVKRLDSWP